MSGKDCPYYQEERCLMSDEALRRELPNVATQFDKLEAEMQNLSRMAGWIKRELQPSFSDLSSRLSEVERSQKHIEAMLSSLIAEHTRPQSVRSWIRYLLK